jgi:hypothetical protein
VIWQTYTGPLVALALLGAVFAFGYWFTPWWTDRTASRDKAAE